MTSLSDIEVWQKTVDQEVENPIIGRESLWITDSNSGSYNGQIVFDTNLLSHSSKWLNMNESYIQIPFTFSMKCKDAPGATESVNAYMAGIKCGYYQIIDSISVEYGTKNAVQLQNYLNFHTQFKMLTKSSFDDIRKNGATFGFIPDSSGSYQFSAAAIAMGDGYCNNDDVPIDIERWLDPQLSNTGFIERRAQTTAFNTVGASYGGLNTIGADPDTRVTNCKKIGKNYFTRIGADDNTHYIWYALATIKLCHLSDFFDKIPLVKNANMRITVNYNSCSTVIAKGSSSGVVVQSIKSHTQLSGHTNPIMVGTRLVRTLTSTGSVNVADAGTPAIPRDVNVTVIENAGSCVGLGTAGDTEITVSCGVATNSLGAPSSGHTLTSARLYVPAYKLNPVRELALIKSKPITSFKYNDIYSYTFKVNGQEAFNQILTNGIMNTKYLLICPFVDGTKAGTFATATIPVWQSPFDSAPGTTSPIVALTELQVSLAGTNIWNQNQRYDYEQFIDELAKINAVMGNMTIGETSGVLSKFDFDNAYRYYVCDLSRRDSSENMVPKAITLSGTNNTALPLTLVCFVAYEREFKIDTVTGEPI